MKQVTNPAVHPELEQRKRELESDLRARFSNQDKKAIAELPVIQAYSAYYRRFKKSYHVQLQLESILFKGKSIPTASVLVEAMFMAELENGMLTAGHDLEQVHFPVGCSAALGNETYILLRGQEQALKPGDLYMADTTGIISSILYGPDQRTQIRPETEQVLFAVYAPAGIGAEATLRHLETIQKYVLVVCPEARTEYLGVLGG